MRNKDTYLSKRHIVLFIIGLLIKLFTIFNYSPEIISKFFAPFVNHIIENPLQNPYNYFYSLGQTEIFPYGSLMFVFLGWGQNIVYWISGSTSSVIPIMFALLIADIALLVVLVSKLKKNVFEVLLLYWLSPLTYYITYIHGQLDVIPSLFLMLGFYFLDRRLGIVSLCLGIAVSIKMNNLLVVPFFLIYLYKKHTSLKNFIKYFSYLAIPYLFFNGVYLFSEGYFNIVLFNQVQLQLLNISIPFSNVSIYIVPILYGLLLLKFMSFTFMVKDLFILFSTITFALINIFLSPQPGWFFWIIPLFLYSIIKYNIKNIYIFSSWAIILTLFFIFPHNIIYTASVLLQLILLKYLYFRILHQYIHSKILYHPYFIGIAGDSGTGKTQLSSSIGEFFGSEFAIVFCGDDLHKWERGSKQWENVTHLNPAAQNLYNNIKDFKKLKQGKKIIRRHYDHSVGQFLEINDITSKNIIIHEGLHSLYLPQERNLYDLKIFLDPQKKLYHQWKINRDVAERGYGVEKILDSINHRLLDKEQYIDIQKQYADIVISYYHHEESIGNVGLYIYTNMLVDLDPFLEKLSQLSGLTFTLAIKQFQRVLDIQISLPISHQQWLGILLELCPQIEEYPFEINFDKQNYQGLALCFVLYNIFNIGTLDD